MLQDTGVSDDDIEVGDAVLGLEGGDCFAGRRGRCCVVFDDNDFATFADWKGLELLCNSGIWAVTDCADGNCVWSCGVRSEEGLANT